MNKLKDGTDKPATENTEVKQEDNNENKQTEKPTDSKTTGTLDATISESKPIKVESSSRRDGNPLKGVDLTTKGSEDPGVELSEHKDSLLSVASLKEVKTLFSDGSTYGNNSIMLALMVANVRTQLEKTIVSLGLGTSSMLSVFIGETKTGLRALHTPSMVLLRIGDPDAPKNNPEWTIHLPEIPSFFRFTAKHDPTYYAEKFMIVDDSVTKVPQLAASRDLVQQGVVEVRYQPQDVTITNTVINPNTKDEKAIVQFSTLSDAATDPSDILRFARSRLRSALNILFMTPFLFTTFSKVILPTERNTDTARYGPAVAALMEGHGVVGDNPNPFLGVYNHPLRWFVDTMRDVWNAYPGRFGAFGAVEYQGLKIAESFYVTTDQFMAKLSHIFYNLIMNWKMNDHDYTALVNAHVDQRGIAQNDDTCPEARRHVTAVIPYARQSYRLLYFLMPQLAARARANWVASAIATNQLTTHDPSADILKVGASTSGMPSPMISVLMQHMRTLSTEQLINWLTLETWSWGIFPRISAHSLTLSASDVIPLVSHLLWPVLSPRIASANLNDIATGIAFILQNWRVAGIDTFITEFGWAGRIGADGRFAPLPGDGLRYLTPDELRQGITVSLLTVPIGQMGRYPHLQRVRRVLTIQFNRVDLNRKRAAGLPFAFDHYQANASWDVSPMQGNATPMITALSTRIKAAIDVAMVLLNEVLSRARSRMSSVNDNQTSLQLETLLRYQAIPTATALTSTAAPMQIAFMNSAPFVIDDRDEGDSFLPYRTYALGSDMNAEQGRVVGSCVVPREQASIDAFLPLSILFCIVGINERPANVDIMTSSRIDGTVLEAREYAALRLSSCLSDYFTLSTYAMKLRAALSLGCMIWRNDIPSPIVQDFFQTLRPYVLFRNYVEIIRTILNTAGVDMPTMMFDWYSRVFGSHLVDPRASEFVMYRLGWDGRYVNERQPQNSMFGVPWTGLPPHMDELMNVAAAYSLAPNAPSFNHLTGVVIGRASVPRLSFENLYPIGNRIPIDYIPGQTLVFAEGVRGRQKAIVLQGQVIFDPADPVLERYYLRVRTIGDILPFDRAWIAASLADNKLVVEAYQQVVIFDVDYVTVVEHDMRILDPLSFFADLLDRPALSYLSYKFIEAKYDAIQVTATFGLAPNFYYSYVFLTEPRDKFFVCGPIMGYVAPPENFKPPPGAMFEVGDDDGTGNAFTALGTPKMSLDIPNMCNSVNTVMDTMRFNYYPHHCLVMSRYDVDL